MQQLTMPCRLSLQDLRVTHETIAQEDFLGAAALLGLSHGSTGLDSFCCTEELVEVEPTALLPVGKPGKATNVEVMLDRWGVLERPQGTAALTGVCLSCYVK